MEAFLTGPLGPELLARLVFGFFAAVAGITLWAHSRDASWILVIAAVLLSYVEVLLRFLDALGVISLDAVVWMGFPVLRVLLAGLVPLLFTFGLIAAVRSFRR